MDIITIEKSDSSGDSPRRRPRKLALNNIENVKRSLARLIRDVDNEPSPDLPKYKVMVSLLNCLVSAYRLDIERRIEKLEAYIDDAKDKNS